MLPSFNCITSFLIRERGVNIKSLKLLLEINNTQLKEKKDILTEFFEDKNAVFLCEAFAYVVQPDEELENR
jgi:hypothetical protein